MAETIIPLDGTDENADWIRSEEVRQKEAEIHARLVRKGRRKGGLFLKKRPEGEEPGA